jgi:hypothetical protein
MKPIFKTKVERLMNKRENLKKELESLDIKISLVLPKLEKGKYYCLEADANHKTYFKYEGQRYNENMLWINKGVYIHLCEEHPTGPHNASCMLNYPYMNWITDYSIHETDKATYLKALKQLKDWTNEIPED